MFYFLPNKVTSRKALPLALCSFVLASLSPSCAKKSPAKDSPAPHSPRKIETIDGEPVGSVPKGEDTVLYRPSPSHENTTEPGNVTSGAPTSSVVAPTVKLELEHLNDGSVEVSASGTGKIFLTVDGTAPTLKGSEPVGTTFEYQGPVRLTRVTIVRAMSIVSGKPTAMRSVSVVPRRFVARLASLPNDGREVDSVYITGSFRNWNQEFKSEYRLEKQSDGSYSKVLLIERRGETDYKFMVRYRDGGVTWVTEPTQPEASRGSYKNNFIADPRIELANKHLAKTDGELDETAVDVTQSPVAALDAGENLVRMKATVLDGDVESVTLKFVGGDAYPLQKSTHKEGEVTKATYSGLVRLPNTSANAKYYFVATDKLNKIAITQDGLIRLDGALQRDDNGLQGFDFKYDAQNKTINGFQVYQLPMWAVDAVWYQIFPERFRNGDESNDLPAQWPLEWNKAFPELGRIQTKVSPWTSSWFTFTPEEIAIERAVMNAYPNSYAATLQARIVRNRRYGGDMEGVRQKIAYLKELGVNAVYFNPVFQSDSEHKYDTQDYRHIDHRFGKMTVNENGEKVLFAEDAQLLAREKLEDSSTWGYTTADKEFIRLVSEFQAQGIRVMIDGVFNHSATNGPLVQDIARRGKESPFFPWFTTSYEGDSDYGQKHCQLSTFFADARKYPHASKIRFNAWDPECTLINHRQGYAESVFHPGLRKYFFDVMERWMAPKVVDGIKFDGVDGIRLDVYNDVDHAFWKQFRVKVKTIKPDSLILAEDWYDGYGILGGDQADSLMNYTVRTLAESWFINVNQREKFRPSQVRSYVDERMNGHRDHIKYGLMSMLSSHDTDRMLSRTMLANRGLTPRPHHDNSWDHEINNKPDKGSPYVNDKPGDLERKFMRVIAAYQMAYVGAPAIYYGDEVGMWGADDPTDRKPMVWDDVAQGQQFETQCLSQSGLFCKERADVRFTVEQDNVMLDTYKRLIAARKQHPAIRRGKMNTAVELRVGNRTFVSGSHEFDNTFLWAFERSYAGKNFAYFVSNQNLEQPNQSFAVHTKFEPGSEVTDLITNHKYHVDSNGWVSLTLERDRAVFLVK